MLNDSLRAISTKSCSSIGQAQAVHAIWIGV
jgi:hypothetical protein